jgi:hypothetical protein
MAISIHLPREVLAAVDTTAASLGLSRSGYITMVLSRQAVAKRPPSWSDGFIEGFCFPFQPSQQALVETWFAR